MNRQVAVNTCTPKIPPRLARESLGSEAKPLTEAAEIQQFAVGQTHHADSFVPDHCSCRARFPICDCSLDHHFLHAFSVASFASFAYPRQRRFLESELPLFSLTVSLACPAAGMASAINTIRLGARWQFKKELIDLWLEANSNLLKKRKDH
jgi:hypothetical protein